MQRSITGAVTALIVVLSLSSQAVADSKPEDVIKYRKSVMSAMSGHIGAYMLITFNKVDGGDYQQSHADAIVNTSKELDLLFPAGTGGDETEALPAIWEESEKFSAAIAKMQDSSVALKEATTSGERKTIMGAFAAVGKACKGCHERFRAEDDDSDSHSH